MKIAIIAFALDTQKAGIHVYLRDLLNSLHRLDIKNEYVIIRSSKKKDFKNWTEIPININPRIPYHLRWHQLVTIPKLLNVIMPNIVVEPGHFGPFNLNSNIKRITVIHDLTPILFPEYHILMSRIIHKLTLPHIVRHAAHLITNSNSTNDDLNRIYPKSIGKSTPIHLGKNKIFTPTYDNQVLAKYNIKTKYLLTVGTLEPRKNLTTLLNAFKKVQSEYENLKLVIVGGSGWKDTEIAKRLIDMKEKSNVIQLGYVELEDLPAIYTAAAIFIYPSFYEGFGFPVLEAMACGTPVITTNTSSLPEITGDTALLINPNSDEDLTKKIFWLLENPDKATTLAKRALTRSDKFNWKKTADQTMEVFQNLA